VNRTTLRTLGAIACAASIAAGLAGCGSSSTLTAAQFRTQADAICTKARPAESASKSAKDFAVVLAGEAAKIKALAAPSELQGKVDALEAAATKIEDTIKVQGDATPPTVLVPAATAAKALV
jgi:hypothetical protein